MERNRRKIGKVTVETMCREFKSRPEDILAAVGPSICQDCYEVSEDVIRQFRKNFPEDCWDALFYQKENQKYQLNLWKANELIFREAGILPEHIAVTNLCTHCNSEILYLTDRRRCKRNSLCISGIRSGGVRVIFLAGRGNPGCSTIPGRSGKRCKPVCNSGLRIQSSNH